MMQYDEIGGRGNMIICIQHYSVSEIVNPGLTPTLAVPLPAHADKNQRYPMRIVYPTNKPTLGQCDEHAD